MLSASSIILRSCMSTSASVDVTIVGGGIVGCATGRELLLRHPHLKVALVDKENKIAAHQSSRNSGVMHAGIYYAPGSLKAKLCVKGIKLVQDYCDSKSIPYKKCGKLIVATDKVEVSRLHDLYKRGVENGVRDLQMVPMEKIKDYEPHCKGVLSALFCKGMGRGELLLCVWQGLEAIWSPHTGIVDYGLVTESYANDMRHSGATVLLSFDVQQLEGTQGHITVRAKDGRVIQTSYCITCAGLQADRVSTLSGCRPDPKIVPFRGEYLLLKPEKRHLVNGNIYPVPDPRFPFLGFHFTPRMNGDVWLGPNAVLAYKREGYKWSDLDPKDVRDALGFRGMQKLMLKYFAFGTREFLTSFSMRAQVQHLQKFIPELSVADVTRGPAGVRAQALDIDGNLVDDFVFDSGSGPIGSRVLHVRNAPSPAATSSLAIAEMVADKADQLFKLSTYDNRNRIEYDQLHMA